MRINYPFAKESKCDFAKGELACPVHNISKDRVNFDPTKIQAILDWSTPNYVT